ncbi:MFS transporter [Mycolicibacterium komossense]|uniref:MFS transporter n=1 Tax=Mycolicibacterium komossense TaxID=1779 RepID=A0ABT3CGF3_9MYCO|nr:MFS transporter [Mycolicibacterium komossense]MCV7228316.1 MFS transporter [Mycolicibacterium komossense]
MGSYMRLLRTPGVFRVTISQLFARLPLGMLSLAILMHVSATTGSYAQAGIVVACVSLAEAIAMPVSARLTGAFGVTPVVLSAAVINGIGFVALALAPAHLLLLAILGTLVGATIPPLMPVVRALYPRMVPPDTVRALFAFDTTAQELIWVTGPVIVTVLASLVSTAVPLLAAAGITVTGSVAFVLSLQPGQPWIKRNRSPFGRVLARQEVILALVANLALVASFMAMEVGVVAQLGHAMAGAAISVSSLGSLIGGLLLGQRRLGLGALVATLGVVMVGTALTGLVTGPLQFVALFAAGFGFAPAMAALYHAVSRGVEEQAAAEAFGWLNTGALAGGAAGTALSGVFNDAWGPIASYALATGLAVAAAASPLIARLAGPVRGFSAEEPVVPASDPEAGCGLVLSQDKPDARASQEADDESAQCHPGIDATTC